MKISDFKKVQGIINEIQECSNRIEGIKNIWKILKIMPNIVYI